MWSQELKCCLPIANSMVRHAYNIYMKAGCFLLWINLCIFVFVYIHNIRYDSTDYHSVLAHSHSKHPAETMLVILYANWNHALWLQCCNVIINKWKDTRLSCGCNYKGVHAYSLASPVLALLCSGRQQSNLWLLGCSVDWGVMLPATPNSIHVEISRFPLSCLKPGFSTMYVVCTNPMCFFK